MNRSRFSAVLGGAITGIVVAIIQGIVEGQTGAYIVRYFFVGAIFGGIVVILGMLEDQLKGR